MKRLLLGVFAVLALGSCQRQTDYYYYIPPQPAAQKVKNPVKIKELVGNPEVDVLWVIDNSGSMDIFQTSVMTNASSFMNSFVAKPNLKWSMGLISTDIMDPPYLGMVPGREFNNTSPNPVVQFNQAVSRLGTSGDGTERPIESASRNFVKYPNFVRPNAVLAIIILSDAPDQSRGVTAISFLDQLVQMKGSVDKIRVYAIIAPAEFGCTTQEDYFRYAGSPYEYLVKSTQGAAYKICAPDYGVTLSDIGNQILSKIEKPRIYLKTRPDPRTIQVFYKGQPLPPDLPNKPGYWTYNVQDNAIVFTDLSFAPGGNEEVELFYDEEIPDTP